MAAAPRFSDEEMLQIVQSERRQSVGFEHDSILLAERERALNYYKGVMPDLPTMANRSQAVDTTISDAIDALQPDLVEIFLAGDDPVTFVPTRPEDEEQAEQETDYVRQVVFDENNGFLTLYSMFKDALQSKIGVVKAWWEDKPIEPEEFTGKTMMEMALAAQDGEILDAEPMGQDEGGQPLFNFRLVREEPRGSVKIMPVPPEDFTVARDTVILADTTYCAFRSRPRAQQLIADGHDRAIVDEIPPYGSDIDQQLQLARDTAGEHQEQQTIVGHHDLRQVEVIEHYVRVDAEGEGKPQLWRVLTGGAETILIECEKVDRLPFAAITPYIVTHRFYGESVADRLMEIQRIKTALRRMFLDSGYFALNQRMEVALDKANEFTISDLLRNEPNMPVRSKTGEALRPLAGPGLSFNVMEALEYFSTQAEQRTGIYRAAQGMNPDTLHDTASGAMALLAAAQKQVRLMAMVFAETGVKDMFLIVHALLRKHASGEAIKRIRGKWTPVDPSQWSERTQMAVQIGLGSSGRHEELQAMNNILAIQEKVIGMQQGAQGPVVTMENAYNAIMRTVAKMGEKAGERFFTDPAQAPPQPPKPNPEAMKLQAEQQMHGDKMQMAAVDAQAKARTDAVRLQMEQEERAAKLNLEREKVQRDDAFRYAQLAQQKELDLAKIAGGFHQATTVQAMKDDTAHDQMRVDLAVQQSEHEDAEVMDD